MPLKIEQEETLGLFAEKFEKPRRQLLNVIGQRVEGQLRNDSEPDSWVRKLLTIGTERPSP